MPRIYISPSTQNRNVGVWPFTTEESQMNAIADILMPLLDEDGRFTTKRDNPSMDDVYSIAIDSNNFKADIHVAIHSNAGGGQGTEVYAYGPNTNSERLAQSLYNQIAPLSPGADRGIKYNPKLIEVGNSVNATSALIELAFHDNLTDATWIAYNHGMIANALYKGICDFYGYDYKGFSPILTPTPSTTILDAPTHIPALVQSLNFTHPNNARVVKDDLFIRDANGSIIPGRYVSNGDDITVLDVGYTRQLALVEYPTPLGVSKGYVANVVSCLQYYHQGLWVNGSTVETVLDENGGALGSLIPGEAATPLYRKNGKLHVVYNTSKGLNTKSGYVAWDGEFTKF